MISSPALLKLVKAIREESVGEHKCLISRLAVIERNSVELPCGHVFHIDYYSSVKKKRRCPYCAKEYCPQTIELPCQHPGCQTMTPIRNRLCKQHNKPRCSFILTRGPSAGLQCSHAVRGQGSMCSRHTPPAGLKDMAELKGKQ